MIVLDLPFPPAVLSPNSRDKWKRIRATTAYRNACGWQILKQRRAREFPSLPLPPPVRMKVVFCVSDFRRRDTDNYVARFKAGQDSLVDAGIIEGDDAVRLKPSYDLEVTPGRNAVRVELEPAT